MNERVSLLEGRPSSSRHGRQLSTRKIFEVEDDAVDFNVDLMLEGADERSRTSVLMTAANFMNGVVGAGIIGLPGALNRAGFTVGIVMCTVVAVLSNVTIKMLAELGSKHGVDTYERLR